MPALKTSTAGKPEVPKPPYSRPVPPGRYARAAGTAVETCRQAIQLHGFLYLSNFGVTEEQYCLMGGGISEEEKERLKWDPSTGSFIGYKPRIGWGEKGKKGSDQIEHFNWYESNFNDETLVPERMKPFMDEIKAYAGHMHNEVNRRFLVLFSRILGLPDNYLWEHVNTKGGILGETSYHRYQVYHPFEVKDVQDATLIMHGHTDYGTTTIIPSQPITCLQMLGNDDVWSYVKYEPHRLLVNLGDALEVVSGGHFKATRHKVVKPPKDQLEYPRVALISFNHSYKDLPLKPLERQGLNKDSDVFGAFCRRLDEGLETPTFGEWKSLRVQGAQAPPDKIVVVNGVKHKEQVFNGTKVLMPI